jgi:hypothetical protein
MKRRLVLIFIFVGAMFVPQALAWTNPASNPATGGGAVTAEGSAPAGAIYISAGGNVGIGTNPSTLLHVSGASPVIRLTDTDTNADSLISANSGVGNLSLYADYYNEITGSSIVFLVDGSEVMRIKDNSLGIGTLAPTQKLEVAGTIYSTSGGFKFPDGTTQASAFLGGSQTLSAANVSAAQFGANTGGGNYSFPLTSQVGFGNFTIRRISTTAIGFYDSTGALAFQIDEGA